METRPPALTESVVRALVPPASREHVLGDLHERYTSPRQYVLDALSTLPFVLASRIRRTTHPIGFVFTVAFLWFGVFYGPFQKSWLVALIPGLVGAIAFVLRDAYRTLNPRWLREAAFDVGTFALAVALSQAVIALVAPELRLSTPTILVGIPVGCIVLFLVRVQMPGGIKTPRMPSEMSLAELRTAVRTYEGAVRRAVYAEIVASFLVIGAFTLFSVVAPTWVAKIGCSLAALGGAFVGWFVARRARVVPIPQHLEFAPLAAAYRQDLERRAQLLRSSLWWYILPALTGPFVLLLAPAIAKGTFSVGILVGLPCLIAFGWLIRALHRFSARKSYELAGQLAVLKEKPC